MPRRAAPSVGHGGIAQLPGSAPAIAARSSRRQYAPGSAACPLSCRGRPTAPTVAPVYPRPDDPPRRRPASPRAPDRRDRGGYALPRRLRHDLADPAGADAGRLPGDRRRHRPARDQRDPRRLRGRRLRGFEPGQDGDRLRRRRASTSRRPSTSTSTSSGTGPPTNASGRPSTTAPARTSRTPQTYESVETSPFVIAGQGPWGPQLKDNLRAALVEAAGTGE